MSNKMTKAELEKRLAAVTRERDELSAKVKADAKTKPASKEPQTLRAFLKDADYVDPATAFGDAETAEKVFEAYYQLRRHIQYSDNLYEIPKTHRRADAALTDGVLKFAENSVGAITFMLNGFKAFQKAIKATGLELPK